MYAINLHFIPTLARGCLSSQTLLSAAPLMGGVFFDKLARSVAPGGPAAETQLRNHRIHLTDAFGWNAKGQRLTGSIYWTSLSCH